LGSSRGQGIKKRERGRIPRVKNITAEAIKLVRDMELRWKRKEVPHGLEMD
jgi:hypothetical protein